MISIIIPTLNERESLPLLFSELGYAVAQFSSPAEVIIVDDGSRDGTAEYVASVQHAFPFALQIVSRQERGLATAVLRGIEESKGDILCVMDADLSHPPMHLVDMVSLIEQGTDMVIGSRHVAGGRVEEWPWHRVLVSRVASVGANVLVPGITDPMSGFFAVKRSVLQGREFSPLGYKILLEFLVKGSYTTVKELPYVFRNREVGKSKLNGRVMREYVRHLGKLYWYKTKDFFKK